LGATSLAVILVSRWLHKSYWAGWAAAVCGILLYLGIYVLLTIFRLGKLELKPRIINPLKREKIARHLRKYAAHPVKVVTIDSMDHEQLDFASYIWRALKSGGWDDLEDGGEPAYEAGNFQMGFPYTVAAATDKYQPFDTY